MNERMEHKCEWCQMEGEQLTVVSIGRGEDSIDIGFKDGDLIVQIALDGAETEELTYPIRYCPMCGRRFCYDA